uniref:Uncharacterized protein n=1 Tax=Salix viminalis TaxID=40686 RepID=A0A6N2KU62_SALVM
MEGEWVSRMIFSEEFVEDPSRWQAEKIEDDVLREIVEEDRVKSFHMIMKNEKASTRLQYCLCFSVVSEVRIIAAMELTENII